MEVYLNIDADDDSDNDPDDDPNDDPDNEQLLPRISFTNFSPGEAVSITVDDNAQQLPNKIGTVPFPVTVTSGSGVPGTLDGLQRRELNQLGTFRLTFRSYRITDNLTVHAVKLKFNIDCPACPEGCGK